MYLANFTELGVFIAEDCRTKWKYLRDHYKRLKQLEKSTKSGQSAPVTKRRWYHMANLQFLDKHLQFAE